MKVAVLFVLLLNGFCAAFEEDVPRFFTNGHGGFQFYHAAPETDRITENLVIKDSDGAGSIRRNYVLPARSNNAIQDNAKKENPARAHKVTKIVINVVPDLVAKNGSDYDDDDDKSAVIKDNVQKQVTEPGEINKATIKKENEHKIITVPNINRNNIEPKISAPEIVRSENARRPLRRNNADQNAKENEIMKRQNTKESPTISSTEKSRRTGSLEKFKNYQKRMKTVRNRPQSQPVTANKPKRNATKNPPFRNYTRNPPPANKFIRKMNKITPNNRKELYSRKPSDKFMQLHKNVGMKISTTTPSLVRNQRHIYSSIIHKKRLV